MQQEIVLWGMVAHAIRSPDYRPGIHVTSTLSNHKIMMYLDSVLVSQCYKYRCTCTGTGTMSECSLVQLLTCAHVSDTYHVHMDKHTPPALYLGTLVLRQMSKWLLIYIL